MNEMLSVFREIFLRATWLMAAAFLLIGLLQRRRPLAASNILSAMQIGLLALPLLVVCLPGVPIPLWSPVDAAPAGRHVKHSPTTSVKTTAPDPTGMRAAANFDDSRGLGRDSETADSPPYSGPSRSFQTSENMAATEVDQQDDQLAVSQSIVVPASALPMWFRWPLVLLTVYVLGVASLVVRLALGMCLIHRFRRSALPVKGDWANRLAVCTQRLGLSRNVDLLASSMVNVPLTVGWIRPVILIPESLLTAPLVHQDAVLLHELSHICRRDYLDVVILQIVQAVYWCHPLAWLIGSAGRVLRERACDDVCIHWLGDREVYRGALLTIARQTICRPRLGLGLAMAQTSRLSLRITQIARSSGCSHCVPSRFVRMTVICSAAVLVATASLFQFVPRTAASPLAVEDAPRNSQSNEQKQVSAESVDLLQLREEEIPSYEREQAALENGGHIPGSLVALLGSSRLKHFSYVKTVAWSPDGSMLGSVGDGYLRLWDPDTGQQLQRFKSEPMWQYGASWLTSLAFEPSGEHVAGGLPTNAVRIWNIKTGLQTQLLKDDEEVLNVAWHPTQPLIATSSIQNAKLWDLSSGKLMRVLGVRDPAFKRKSTSDYVHVQFAPDGRHVVVSHADGSVRFWDVANGDVTRTIQAHDVAIQAMSIDAVRNRLATGGVDGNVRVWQLSSGEKLREIQAHDRFVQGLAFDPRQDVIFSSGLDGTIRKWDLGTGEKQLEFKANRYVGSGPVSIHPTRDLIASSGSAVRIWNASTGKPHVETQGHLGGIQGLAFTPNGTRLLSAGNDTTVRVWDPRRRTPLATYEVYDSAVKGIDVLPDGKSFVTISDYARTVDIRKVDDGTILNSWKAEGRRNESVTVSPNGRWLAAKFDQLVVWDLVKRERHGEIRSNPGTPHFSPDGKRLLVVGSEFNRGTGSKSRLQTWDVESLQSTLMLEDVQGLANINASALSPDGVTLALCGLAYDQNEKSHHQLVLWDWTTNETRLVVDTQEHSPDMAAFAPDGKSLVTAATREGAVRIWDPRDGSQREAISVREGDHWSIGAVAFAPDSRHIAVALGNGTIDMIRIKPAPADVPVKVLVPEQFTEPKTDLWTTLIDQPAPELQAAGWLFGEPTNLAKLRGRWVILYFWNNAWSDREIPDWMDVHQRFSERATVIVVKAPHAESIDQERAYFERVSHDQWQDRALPFRVLIDQRKPNIIPGTNLETGGATHAAFRMMQSRRGYWTNPVALLIDPDGIVRGRINDRSRRQIIRQLESVTDSKSVTPEWETAFLQVLRQNLWAK